MLKSIILLFSSSFIGRSLGLLRFLVLVSIFGKGSFTDTIIYFTTFIWLVNNFFVVPIVNRSLIADLGGAHESEYFYVINSLIKKVLKSALITGLTMTLVLEVYNLFHNNLELDIYSKFFILLIFPVLGLNEIFSLFNQFKKKYFLYSINTAIWNTTLIFSLMVYYFLGIKEGFVIYFLFLFLGKVLSLTIQFKNTHLDIGVLNFLLLNNVYKRSKKEKNDYFYQISIILFSSITFFDLNLLGTTNLVGIITVYSIILKLPSLLQSLLTSALIPVFFNKLVLEKGKLLTTFTLFATTCFLAFSLLGVFYALFGESIHNLLFDYQLSVSDNKNLIVGLLYMFFSIVSLFLIRLSVEFKFQKLIFISLLLGLFFKLIYSQIITITINSLLISNLVIFSIVVLSGAFFIASRNKKTHEYITT
tara:strand:+ start:186 stop:1442 length:1257 start_codon:yes stop_codon:yes gene_type:complete